MDFWTSGFWAPGFWATAFWTESGGGGGGSDEATVANMLSTLSISLRIGH